MATGYQYAPLDRARQEIRLLCFDSRLSTSDECFKAPLRCTIKQISTLRDPLPEYYAISYTWGDSKTRGLLVVDGKDITVPENAEIALRHLLAKQIEERNAPHRAMLAESSVFAASPTAADSPEFSNWPSTEIRFWLDAICINQHDLEEKSWQLLIISDIYSQARELCIWLGEDDDGMGEDIEKHITGVIEQCKDETNDLADFFETVWSLTPTDLSPRSAPAPLPTVCNISVLRSLYSSPWFQRLWVLQESVLANNTKCYRGRHVILFRHVALAARWIWYRTLGRLFPADTQYSAHTIGIQNASTMWDMISTPFIIPRVLSNLLLLGMRFDVTDPRDKVYAVLGLLNDEDFAQLKTELLPDYSIPVPELYTRITRAVIEDTQSLFIMRIGSTLIPAARRDQDAIEVPSWVPRFDWIHDVNKGSPCAIRTTPKATSGDFGLCLRVWECLPSVLAVQGLPVDDIDYVASESWSTTKCGSEVLKLQVNEAWNTAAERGNRELCRSLETAFAFTICAGRNKYMSDLTYDEHFHGHCAAFFATCGTSCKQLADYFSNSAQNGQTHALDEELEIPRAMVQNTRNLSFLVTSEGRLGMGPKTARSGDRVCQIPGCRVPSILRREGAFWRYIGDAYVYGLMDEECLQERVKVGRLESDMQWFNIH